jgi:hypothetical protein
LSDDEMDALAGFDELFQRRDGEEGGAAKDEVERHFWIL